MVNINDFCCKNCSDLLWEKKVLVIEKKLLKCEAEGQEFAIFLRSLEQVIQTVKGVRTFFGNWMLFQLVPGDFSDLIK